jgi:DNA replication and repair protein RecF
VFSPERQQLLSGASEYRRGLMDWALFHVEPSYGEALQRYRRALRQRNVALRQRAAAEQVRAWDGELAEWGTGVDEARAAYVDDLRVALAKVLVERAGGAVEVGYRRGWASGHSLAQALTVGLERDRTQGWTGAGPHLADLLISVGGRPARVVASRGQGRVIVASLVLAHVLLLRARTGHSPVVLADDVASELDGAGRAWFVEELAGLPSQVFVTAVEKELLPITRLQSEHKVFHVERGRITELL